MSYSETDLFVHGEYPTAAKLNLLIDNQAYFNAVLDPSVYGSKDGSRLVFVNRFRYLWFKGTGNIIDLSNSSNTVSISESDTDTMTQFDLDSITWMYRGKIYYVYNCTTALESTD
jgi:hypothetical protein